MTKPIRLGILGPSDIAYRRFLPALLKQEGRFTYVGVSEASAQEWSGAVSPSPERLMSRRHKLNAFVSNYGGFVFSSYSEMLARSDVDAVYIPLPPALHAYWGKLALKAGKHIFLEKPFTTSQKDTEELLLLAEARNLAVHENYMFVYHNQLAKVHDLLTQGAIGIPRLYRFCFGFPRRLATDFRYNKELGGGALMDCGGYPLRLCRELLGDSAKVVHARLINQAGLDVDIAGNATIENHIGVTAQVAFGMDNEYRCELDIWGSTGSLCAPRIFTAGSDVTPTITLRQGGEETTLTIPCFDQFEASLLRFYCSITEPSSRCSMINAVMHQADMVEAVQELGQDKSKENR